VIPNPNKIKVHHSEGGDGVLFAIFLKEKKSLIFTNIKFQL
jgi:hypothetical protein